SSLRNVVRMLMALGNDQALNGKVHVVMNRVGGETDISLKKAEETIGKPIYWQGPNDVRTVTEGRGQGGPPTPERPRGKPQQSFPGLVNLLTGKDGAAPAKEKKGWSLFSRR